jgi:hypothetical protein
VNKAEPAGHVVANTSGVSARYRIGKLFPFLQGNP